LKIKIGENKNSLVFTDLNKKSKNPSFPAFIHLTESLYELHSSCFIKEAMLQRELFHTAAKMPLPHERKENLAKITQLNKHIKEQ
jgi:hypothetical protein